MFERYSDVCITINPADLYRRKSVYGFVISTTEPGVSIKDTIIISGPLTAKIFQRAKYIPGNLNAAVTLSRNKDGRTIWQAQSILSIDSVFEETFVDKLINLRNQHVLLKTEEMKELSRELIENDFELFSNDRKSAINLLRERKNRLLNDRKTAFNAIIEENIDCMAILKIASKLLLKVDMTRERLDLLLELQERYVRLDDSEVQKIEKEAIELQGGFTRNYKKTIETVEQLCRESIFKRQAYFEALLERHIKPGTALPLIRSAVENNLIFSFHMNKPQVKLTGVVDMVKWD